jgi:hypothetical protein
MAVLSSDPLSNPDHADEHSGLNSLVEALQLLVGTDNSLSTSTLDYNVRTVSGDHLNDGSITKPKLDVEVANLLVPAGTVVGYASTTGSNIPSGWEPLIGQTLYDAETSYPELWSVVPASWKSGVSIELPNATGVFLRGVDSETIGSRVIVDPPVSNLNANNIPPHAHPSHSAFLYHSHGETVNRYNYVVTDHYHGGAHGHAPFGNVTVALNRTSYWYSWNSYIGYIYASSSAVNLVNSAESLSQGGTSSNYTSASTFNVGTSGVDGVGTQQVFYEDNTGNKYGEGFSNISLILIIKIH